jgi:hypothetical protein
MAVFEALLLANSVGWSLVVGLLVHVLKGRSLMSSREQRLHPVATDGFLERLMPPPRVSLSRSTDV